MANVTAVQDLRVHTFLLGGIDGSSIIINRSHTVVCHGSQSITTRGVVMKLITKEIERKLKANQAIMDEADEKGMDFSIADRQPVVKLFNPVGAGTWFLFSMDDNGRAFGWAKISDGEYGYVNVNELQQIDVGFHLGIERDINYSPLTFKQTAEMWG